MVKLICKSEMDFGGKRRVYAWDLVVPYPLLWEFTGGRITKEEFIICLMITHQTGRETFGRRKLCSLTDFELAKVCQLSVEIIQHNLKSLEEKKMIKILFKKEIRCIITSWYKLTFPKRKMKM